MHFRSIFDRLGIPVAADIVLPAGGGTKDLNFNPDLYIAACLIDPNHGYKWLDNCQGTPMEKETLKRKLFHKLIQTM